MSDKTYGEDNDNITPMMARREPEDFELKAKQIVAGYFNKDLHSRNDLKLYVEDLYIVWFCKTLQNWKALISTDMIRPGQYYEVTFDGDNKRAYLDIYTKSENIVCVDDYGYS